MASKVKPIPDGAPVVTPRLVCRDPAAMIEFMKTVLGAEERMRLPGPDGTVGHAVMMMGTGMILIEADVPTLASRAPQPDGSSPVVIKVYVEDVDQAVERAVAAGSKVLIPIKDQFWGDRTAGVMDPSGHVWTFATRIEEPTEEEMRDGLARLLKG